MIGLDQMMIGARLYSNDPAQPPYAQGIFDGAIAEVLVYDRALSDAERQKVEQTLLAKTVALHALLHGAKGHALEPVKDPPPVQMLVPGFTVRELPLQDRQPQQRALSPRRQARRVSATTDAFICSPTPTATASRTRPSCSGIRHTMRGPIGMALTAKGDPRGDGVFVASKGKVSLILDKDRDGRADEEKVIATGWQEAFTAWTRSASPSIRRTARSTSASAAPTSRMRI